MNFILKSFDELTNSELYSLLKLRNEVFIVEQKCAYLDLDNLDLRAKHVMGIDKNEVIAYSRILAPGLVYNEPAIGRVVVNVKFRDKNLGKELMKYSLLKTAELFDCKTIIISAQKYLLKFYSELGFESIGEEYLEDDIPHVKMKYQVLNN